MSPKAKENVELTWRVVALALLSVCVYFLVKIDEKVDYSYKFNVTQEGINVNVQGNLNRIENQLKDHTHEISVIDSRQDILSERFYSIEAIVKYRKDHPQIVSQNN